MNYIYRFFYSLCIISNLNCMQFNSDKPLTKEEIANLAKLGECNHYYYQNSKNFRLKSEVIEHNVITDDHNITTDNNTIANNNEEFEKLLQLNMYINQLRLQNSLMPQNSLNTTQNTISTNNSYALISGTPIHNVPTLNTSIPRNISIPQNILCPNINTHNIDTPINAHHIAIPSIKISSIKTPNAKTQSIKTQSINEIPDINNTNLPNNKIHQGTRYQDTQYQDTQYQNTKYQNAEITDTKIKILETSNGKIPNGKILYTKLNGMAKIDQYSEISLNFLKLLASYDDNFDTYYNKLDKYMNNFSPIISRNDFIKMVNLFKSIKLNPILIKLVLSNIDHTDKMYTQLEEQIKSNNLAQNKELLHDFINIMVFLTRSYPTKIIKEEIKINKNCKLILNDKQNIDLFLDIFTRKFQDKMKNFMFNYLREYVSDLENINFKKMQILLNHKIYDLMRYAILHSEYKFTEKETYDQYQLYTKQIINNMLSKVFKAEQQYIGTHKCDSYQYGVPLDTYICDTYVYSTEPYGLRYTIKWISNKDKKVINTIMNNINLLDWINNINLVLKIIGIARNHINL